MPVGGHNSPCALTVGTFDGVHLGHDHLVRTARDAVGRAGRVLALVFDPHPLSALRPGTEPARLSTFTQRDAWLRAAGVDEVVRLQPTPALLDQSARAFVQELVTQYQPAAIVEGPDFRFGKGRLGDANLLKALGAEFGVAVRIVEPVEAVLDDHSIVPARSTIVRWLVRHGRIGDAARVLGRPFQIEGIVERGDRRGRTIGYPTANIDTPCLLPADGVYAGIAHLDDGRRFPAAVSVGTKPTFDGASRALEAFLLDAGASTEWAPIGGLAEYGWRIRLDLTAFLRDQAKFPSLESLLEQMSADCRRVRQLASAGLASARGKP